MIKKNIYDRITQQVTQNLEKAGSCRLKTCCITQKIVVVALVETDGLMKAVVEVGVE